ncbi:MAG: MarR family transcriptional regulator [Bacteroidota bacterium]
MPKHHSFEEGKEKFIQAWGALGSSWGVTRTMAQIHALLLLATEAVSADEVMEELQVSRGSANTNLRQLIDWGLVYKELKTGERREYFKAEKDMGKVVKQIIIQRKKRELEPMLRLLDDLSEVDGDSEEAHELRQVVQELKLFSGKADRALNLLVKADSNWFFSTFLSMIK